MKYAIVVWAVSIAWLWWMAEHAPDAADALPHSRKCAWCGRYISTEDRWLADNGAKLTHGICPSCAESLGDL